MRFFLPTPLPGDPTNLKSQNVTVTYRQLAGTQWKEVPSEGATRIKPVILEKIDIQLDTVSKLKSKKHIAGGALGPSLLLSVRHSND